MERILRMKLDLIDWISDMAMKLIDALSDPRDRAHEAWTKYSKRR